MVPTSVNCGRSSCGGFADGATGFGTAAAAGGGGRREEEKIGRSRVTDRLESGISQSGLGLSVRSGADGCASGGRTTMIGAGAGCSQTDEPAGASDGGVSRSGASVGS